MVPNILFFVNHPFTVKNDLILAKKPQDKTLIKRKTFYKNPLSYHYTPLAFGEWGVEILISSLF